MKNLILVWTMFIAILTVAVANLQLSFAQEQLENNTSDNNTKITKTSTNSYIIVDDGPELVGAFDVIYTITGSSESLNKSKESIMSIVQDDLDSSPTIGYIRAAAADNQTQREGVGLPNPFVDLQTINSTVIQQLSDSINSASALNLTIVEIKCDFGMNIKDWKCEDHGIF